MTKAKQEFSTIPLPEAIQRFDRLLSGRVRTLEEIRRTPVGLLSEDEIDQLSAEGQKYARAFQAREAKEAACPGHVRVEMSTREQANRGLHLGKCRHCGKDMSYDSGD